MSRAPVAPAKRPAAAASGACAPLSCLGIQRRVEILPP
jgi:hypothetical protein